MLSACLMTQGGSIYDSKRIIGLMLAMLVKNERQDAGLCSDRVWFRL